MNSIIIRISIIVSIFFATLPTYPMHPQLPSTKGEYAWLGIGACTGIFFTTVTAIFLHQRAKNKWRQEKIKMEAEATQQKDAIKVGAQRRNSCDFWSRLAAFQQEQESNGEPAECTCGFYERFGRFIKRTEGQPAQPNSTVWDRVDALDRSENNKEQQAAASQPGSAQLKREHADKTRSPQALQVAASWNKRIDEERAQKAREIAEQEKLERNKKTASRPPSPQHSNAHLNTSST